MDGEGIRSIRGGKEIGFDLVLNFEMEQMEVMLGQVLCYKMSLWDAFRS